jgi:hypothetical protein
LLDTESLVEPASAALRERLAQQSFHAALDAYVQLANPAVDGRRQVLCPKRTLQTSIYNTARGSDEPLQLRCSEIVADGDLPTVHGTFPLEYH